MRQTKYKRLLGAAALGMALGMAGWALGCNLIIGLNDVPPATDTDGAPGGDADATSSGDTDATSSGDAGADAKGNGDATMGPEGGSPDAGGGDVDSGPNSPNEAGCANAELLCDGGCVPASDKRNCGSCGHDCTSLPQVTGAVSCAAGGCVFDITACAPGYTHCSGGPDLGCETPIDTTQNCGACNVTCDAGAPHCAASDDGGPPYACCAAGRTACGSTCSDLTTDPNNCGRCGHSCQGGTCSGTPPMCQPVLLATTPVYIQGLAVSTTTVYWSSTASGAMQPAGTIQSVPITGGTVSTFATGLDHPGGVAVDNTQVYWTVDSGNTVLRRSVGGGGITTVASGQNIPWTIALDSQNVYWATYLAPDGGMGANVMSAPINGGAPVTIATGQVAPASIGLTSTDVYWTNYGGSMVMRAPIGGGGVVTTLVDGGLPDGASNGAGGLAMGPAAVYWTAAGPTNAEGMVMSLPLTGGTPAILASGQNGVALMTSDATNLYWTNTSGSVVTLPFGGGVPTTLATGQAGPGNIAVDSTTVYWANANGGQIMKVAKP
jgi:hypothetical protein